MAIDFSAGLISRAGLRAAPRENRAEVRNYARGIRRDLGPSLDVWRDRAAALLILRFEDLIRHPERVFGERLIPFLNLDPAALPFMVATVRRRSPRADPLPADLIAGLFRNLGDPES